MAFKIALSATFLSHVKLPSLDGKGRRVENVIRLIFKRHDREQLDALLQGWRDETRDMAGTELSIADKIDSDIKTLKQFVVGWEDVQIGDSTEFNDENLRKVLVAFPAGATLIMDAFIRSNAGAELGN